MELGQETDESGPGGSLLGELHVGTGLQLLHGERPPSAGHLLVRSPAGAAGAPRPASRPRRPGSLRTPAPVGRAHHQGACPGSRAAKQVRRCRRRLPWDGARGRSKRLGGEALRNAPCVHIAEEDQPGYTGGVKRVHGEDVARAWGGRPREDASQALGVQARPRRGRQGTGVGEARPPRRKGMWGTGGVRRVHAGEDSPTRALGVRARPPRRGPPARALGVAKGASTRRGAASQGTGSRGASTAEDRQPGHWGSRGASRGDSQGTGVAAGRGQSLCWAFT